MANNAESTPVAATATPLASTAEPTLGAKAQVTDSSSAFSLPAFEGLVPPHVVDLAGKLFQQAIEKYALQALSESAAVSSSAGHHKSTTASTDSCSTYAMSMPSLSPFDSASDLSDTSTCPSTSGFFGTASKDEIPSANNADSKPLLGSHHQEHSDALKSCANSCASCNDLRAQVTESQSLIANLTREVSFLRSLLNPSKPVGGGTDVARPSAGHAHLEAPAKTTVPEQLKVEVYGNDKEDTALVELFARFEYLKSKSKDKPPEKPKDLAPEPHDVSSDTSTVAPLISSIDPYSSYSSSALILLHTDEHLYDDDTSSTTSFDTTESYSTEDLSDDDSADNCINDDADSDEPFGPYDVPTYPFGYSAAEAETILNTPLDNFFRGPSNPAPFNTSNNACNQPSTAYDLLASGFVIGEVADDESDCDSLSGPFENVAVPKSGVRVGVLDASRWW